MKAMRSLSSDSQIVRSSFSAHLMGTWHLKPGYPLKYLASPSCTNANVAVTGQSGLRQGEDEGY